MNIQINMIFKHIQLQFGRNSLKFLQKATRVSILFGIERFSHIPLFDGKKYYI